MKILGIGVLLSIGALNGKQFERWYEPVIRRNFDALSTSRVRLVRTTYERYRLRMRVAHALGGLSIVLVAAFCLAGLLLQRFGVVDT